MDENKQQSFEPQQIDIEMQEKDPNGLERYRKISVSTEDIIAIFAGIVAIIIALGMVFGGIPVNELTVGVLTFSGVGAVITEIISTRKKKRRPKS